MEEEMVVRNYSPKTIRTYLSLLNHLAVYYGCSPEHLNIPQIKRYLYYCINEKGLSVGTINQIISANEKPTLLLSFIIQAYKPLFAFKTCSSSQAYVHLEM